MPSNYSVPADEIERPPFMVTLGLMPPYMAEDVEKAYLMKVKEIRPDLGGDPKPFYALQTAYMEAKEYVKFRGDRRGWIAKRMDEYLALQEVMEGLKKFGAKFDTRSLDWLKKSFGDFADLTESIIAIGLHDAVHGDEFIEFLTIHQDSLLELQWLDLSGCAISDSAVRQLIVFRRLHELNLSHTPITADALQIIDYLPELEIIHIEGTHLGWFERRKLARKLRRKQKLAATIRAIHPTTIR